MEERGRERITIHKKQLMRVPEKVRVGRCVMLHPFITCRRSKSFRHKLGTLCSTWTLRTRWLALLKG